MKVQHRSSVSTECRNVNSITAILGRTLRDEFFGVSEKDKFIELEMQKGQYRSNVSNGFYTRNITPEQRTIIMKFLVHLNVSIFPSFTSLQFLFLGIIEYGIFEFSGTFVLSLVFSLSNGKDF